MSERPDLDRLADFIEGALDGTPDADAVRELVATDTAWRALRADLVTADAAVRAALSRYAAQPEPIPADVVARLASVLHSPPAAPGPIGDPMDSPLAADDAAMRSTVAGVPAPGSHRPTVDETRPRSLRVGSAGPGRAVQGWRRRRLAVLSALAAVAAVAVGLFVLVPRYSDPLKRDTYGSAAEAPAKQDAAAPASGGGAVPASGGRQMASGRNYQPGGFAELGYDAGQEHALDSAGRQNGSRASADGSSTKALPGVPAELTGLTAAEARAACVQAVISVHGGTVAVMDYARFAGRPAVIMLLDGTRTGGGARWVVVVGPACGRGTAFTDEIHNGPVG